MRCLSDLGICTTICTWYIIKTIKEVQFRNSSLSAKTEHYIISVDQRKLNYFYYAIIFCGDLILQIFDKKYINRSILEAYAKGPRLEPCHSPRHSSNHELMNNKSFTFVISKKSNLNIFKPRNSTLGNRISLYWIKSVHVCRSVLKAINC